MARKNSSAKTEDNINNCIVGGVSFFMAVELVCILN